MVSDRKPPIIIRPTCPPPDQSMAAAFVFVHGLGDEAEGVESTLILPSRVWFVLIYLQMSHVNSKMRASFHI
jgi:hypothetical protein